MKALSPDMSEYLFRSFYRVVLGIRRGLNFERRDVKATAAYCRKRGGYFPEYIDFGYNYILLVRKLKKRWPDI